MIFRKLKPALEEAAPRKGKAGDADPDEALGAAFDPKQFKRLLEFALPHQRLFAASFAVLVIGFELQRRSVAVELDSAVRPFEVVTLPHFLDCLIDGVVDLLQIGARAYVERVIRHWGDAGLV